MKVECSLITTIKNRASHFLQTIPSLTSQVGVPYELIIVDLQSQDELNKLFRDDLPLRHEIFSPDLVQIKRLHFLEDTKFNPRKAKNAGAGASDRSSKFLAFSDVDVFLGMSYLRDFCAKTQQAQTFVVTRVQNTASAPSRRISPEINYGNCVIARKDYFEVGGFNESVSNYGGDDDDLYHRLKCLGLKEFNPKNRFEAMHYSIVHGDDLRLANFEEPTRCNKEIRFKEIYENTQYRNDHCNHLDSIYLEKIAKVEYLFKRDS